MSFSNNDSSSGLRSFVSESQLEERRKRRQEEWEKVRTDDQPLEAPEEVYDSRTLYDRLKEQRIKKDEEFEESKKLKHLIKGLDNDEISFLEMVDNNKIQLETERWKEEVLAIEEYKRAVAHLNSEEQEKRLQEFKYDILLNSRKKKNESNSVSPKDNNQNKTLKKSSQSALLANVVKKRTHSESSEEKDSKKVKNSSIESDKSSDLNKETNSTSIKSDESSTSAEQTIKCIGVLPGLGFYASSDSSDSENSSNSEYERDDLNNFKLIVRRKRVCNQENKSETIQSAE